MHADNIEWADDMDTWKNNPSNRSKSKAGDDRTPAWRWIGCLNYDRAKDVITIPSEYIMRSIMGGAANVPVGRGKQTFKALSQSGMLCRNEHWPLLVNGSTISMSRILNLRSVSDFKEHQEAAISMGFDLFVKRAKIGSSKHVRVRPRFTNWATVGEITITDEQITKNILGQILQIAGNLKGLGDWRPGAPTPGSFGIYTAEVL